jgi:hypothetical protein
MARKPENRTQFSARVDAETPDVIKELAFKMGYLYDGDGSPGKLLDAIAKGEVKLFQEVKP